MPPVLTEASTLKCVHEGIFKVTPSQEKLMVDGKAVLVKGDLKDFLFTTCPLAQNPCTKTAEPDVGVSTTLQVGEDQPVLLAKAGGSTDRGTWSVVEAGQTKLEAT